jgi:hypothetical protein
MRTKLSRTKDLQLEHGTAPAWISIAPAEAEICSILLTRGTRGPILWGGGSDAPAGTDQNVSKIEQTRRNDYGQNGTDRRFSGVRPSKEDVR